MAKHFVPEGKMHITHKDGMFHALHYPGAYNVSTGEEVESVVVTEPFVISKHDEVLDIYDKYNNDDKPRFDLNYIYKFKIQITDPEKYAKFHAEVNVYNDGHLLKAETAEEYLELLLAIAIRDRVCNTPHEEVLSVFGREINVFNDIIFADLKSKASDCGIQILDMSFMVVGISNYQNKEED